MCFPPSTEPLFEQGSRVNNHKKKKFNLRARLIGDNFQLLSQLNSSNGEKFVSSGENYQPDQAIQTGIRPHGA